MMEQETAKAFETMAEAVEKVEVQPNYKWGWLLILPLFYVASYIEGKAIGEFVARKIMNED